MTVEKTHAFVLKTLPYRESSGIFHLLTERQGVIHGIAKGIRKKKASVLFPERGFSIETLVYSKPNRELHTLGEIQTIDYFPRIRRNLMKTAIRDAAFETILTSVSPGFPCPDLFSLTREFCGALEREERPVLLLWRFYMAFSIVMGVGLRIERCAACDRKLSGVGFGFLVNERGGIVCENCISRQDHHTRIPETVLHFLQARDVSSIAECPDGLSCADVRRITRLLAAYCQYHCSACKPLKALDFLDSLLSAGHQILPKMP